jgi:core-2/I-Branching enzyme
MSSPIGFVVLTYSDPPQIVRLLTRLRELYGPAAPIALHHNFGQSPLDVSALPAGVRVVQPHLSTGWDSWNTVEATLAGLRLLYREAEGPDYVVHLSGTDYPVARPERVVSDLRAVGADAYVKATPVRPWRRDRGAVAGPLGFGVNEGAANQKVCYRRYFPTTFRPLGIRLRIRSPLLAPLLSPFSSRLGCHAGEHWWTLGRRAVEHLLATREDRPELARWFAERPIPEEGYVQTVVCNGPGLRIERRNFRHVDWSSRARSPRTLGVADVPTILAGGAHFARKFAPDDPALDAIDAALGLPPWRGASAR